MDDHGTSVMGCGKDAINERYWYADGQAACLRGAGRPGVTAEGEEGTDLGRADTTEAAFEG